MENPYFSLLQTLDMAHTPLNVAKGAFHEVPLVF